VKQDKVQQQLDNQYFYVCIMHFVQIIIQTNQFTIHIYIYIYIYINNILYNVSTPTYFNSPTLSSVYVYILIYGFY